MGRWPPSSSSNTKSQAIVPMLTCSEPMTRCARTGAPCSLRLNIKSRGSRTEGAGVRLLQRRGGANEQKLEGNGRMNSTSRKGESSQRKSLLVTRISLVEVLVHVCSFLLDCLSSGATRPRELIFTSGGF